DKFGHRRRQLPRPVGRDRIVAVAFRSAGALATYTNPPVIEYPAGVASGDLLVIQYMGHNGSPPNTPSGWTALLAPVTLSGSIEPSIWVFYKIAGGSEPSTVTISVSSGSLAATGIMSAYTG